MTALRITGLIVAAVVCVSAAGAMSVARIDGRCGRESTVDAVLKQVQADHPDDTVVAGVRMIGGNMFFGARRCAMLTMPFRGNANQAQERWTRVEYATPFVAGRNALTFAGTQAAETGNDTRD